MATGTLGKGSLLLTKKTNQNHKEVAPLLDHQRDRKQELEVGRKRTL